MLLLLKTTYLAVKRRWSPSPQPLRCDTAQTRCEGAQRRCCESVERCIGSASDPLLEAAVVTKNMENQGHYTWVLSVCVSPNGKLLFTGAFGAGKMTASKLPAKPAAEAETALSGDTSSSSHASVIMSPFLHARKWMDKNAAWTKTVKASAVHDAEARREHWLRRGRT